MPNLKDQPVEGGPTQPVYIMNGAPGGSGNSGFGSDVGIVSGTAASAGNNSLISAPGSGKRLVVWSFVVQNETANATTIILRDQVARFRVLAQNQGDGLAMAFDSFQPWRLNENTALVMSLSGANSCGYSIQYSIEVI